MVCLPLQIGVTEHDFQNLALAVGFGLLIGLQREWAQKPLAGIRTYPLLALFGTLCGLLADDFGSWMPAAGLLFVSAMVIVRGSLRDLEKKRHASGITTEVAMVLTFTIGVLLAPGYRVAAGCVTGAVLVLLQWKAPMHRWVAKLDRAELQALARLVLIGLVILPLMPDTTLGPYQVLNPFRIWLMVVLIVGISLTAYLVSRCLGPKRGSLAAGVLGGLISSTATTVSTAGSVKRSDSQTPVLTSRTAALVIMLASTIVFVRVAIELLVVARASTPQMLPPLMLLMLLMAGICVFLFTRVRNHGATGSEAGEPPSEFGSAVVFGLLYALVLIAVAAAKEHLPSEWLFLVAAISGLTDMDAITLSTGQLVDAGKIDPSTGWRLILVGGLSNLAFKAAAVAALGTLSLFRQVLLAFGATIVAGIGLLFLWPG